MEHERALREFLVASTNGLGISLTEQQISRFLIYLSQLLDWNRTINLTRITDPFEIISKHFVDSLTALIAFEFPSQAIVVDVGSGAGFPGIPLKIVRSDLRMILVEPSQKKCSFLRSIIGVMKLELMSIYSGDLKQYAAEHPRPLADVIMTRALRFDHIANLATLLLSSAGHVLLYRTEKMERPPLHGFQVASNHDFVLPMNHGSRVVTVLARSAA